MGIEICFGNRTFYISVWPPYIQHKDHEDFEVALNFFKGRKK